MFVNVIELYFSIHQKKRKRSVVGDGMRVLRHMISFQYLVTRSDSCTVLSLYIRTF